MTADLTALIGADMPPASDALLLQLAESVAGYRKHREANDGTTNTMYGLNITAFMGERMGVVLARLVATEAEVARLRAELAEERKTPAQRANDRVRALREAGDIEGALAFAEAYEASAAYDATHPRI
jgi:hypothetical protein